MIETFDETGRAPRPERLAAALDRLACELGAGDRDLTVAFLDDEAMAERNRSQRGTDGPTDVLSYPSWEPDDGDAVPRVQHLGDVLIGVDVASRQAPEHGHDLERELCVLAAHGLMHLLGFDHPDAAAWRPFLAAQRRIVALYDEAS
ncbi:MAG: rRNA maturation RNase YbeY [Trueperaceae bacterium]